MSHLCSSGLVWSVLLLAAECTVGVLLFGILYCQAAVESTPLRPLRQRLLHRVEIQPACILAICTACLCSS